ELAAIARRVAAATSTGVASAAGSCGTGGAPAPPLQPARAAASTSTATAARSPAGALGETTRSMWFSMLAGPRRGVVRCCIQVDHQHNGPPCAEGHGRSTVAPALLDRAQCDRFRLALGQGYTAAVSCPAG